MPKMSVVTDRHPNSTRPLITVHGPFDSKEEADANAKNLRKSGGWGAVKVRRATAEEIRGPECLREIFRL